MVESTTIQTITACLNYYSITLTAPSAGTVVLTSTVHVWIDHTTGTTDGWWFSHRTSATDCSDTVVTGSGANFISEISGAWPTDGLINAAGTLVQTFTVPAAGTYTYYLNVWMWSGQNASDRVRNAYTVAVFYPS